MEFLTTYNLWGLVIGVATFLIIGLFHPLVVKAEYYFGAGIWWAFLLAGLVFMGLSVMVHHLILSTIFGVIAFSSFWSILEVRDQEKRVEKGWFPANRHRSGCRILGKNPMHRHPDLPTLRPSG